MKCFKDIRNKKKLFNSLKDELNFIEEQLSFYACYSYTTEELLDNEIMKFRASHISSLHKQRNMIYVKLNKFNWLTKIFFKLWQ